MSRDLGAISLGELRRRHLQSGEPVTPALLRALQRDPRAGARSLHAVLRRRFERERAERLRLDALLNFERVLWRTGVQRVAGVDEAGMGPLAGPVVAAAVVFPPETSIAGIDDSKRLDAGTRERLADEIRKCASGIGLGVVEVEEIDRVNIHQAGLLAMQRAVLALPEPPQHVLVDARTVPGLGDIPQNPFQKGDGLDFSIAAASILAKTHRDRLMDALDRAFPAYGFARHRGYGTPEHQAALRQHGPCPAHRRSFGVLRELQGQCTDGFYALKDAFSRVDGRAALRAFEARLAAERETLPDAEYRKLRILVARRWKAL